MRSAVTVSLVPEARGGPFVFWDNLELACNRAAGADLGFDGIELFPPGADAVDAQLLRQILHRNRLQLAAVGTGAGWVIRRLTLTHPDAEIRLRARQFIEAIIDFAGAFGTPAIVGSMQGRAEGEVTRDRALGWLAEALEQLGPRADGYDVPLLLEPLNRYETNLLNTVEQTLGFLEPLRTRNVRLLCDLFHMNIEEPSIADALRAAGPMLGHVHFADSNRRAVGMGHTDVATVAVALRELGYTGFLSAEVLPLPGSEEAARMTIESFRNLFPAG